MPSERQTFSNSWSRVSRLTPTLRAHVEIHRQLYRGEIWHVVSDPITNDFFRLNPVAYHFVGLLDGWRSVDEVWQLTLDRFGDAAPTQNEVIGLLGQMNQANLLRVDLPADAEPLLKRSRKRRMQKVRGQLMSIMALKIPLFNPNSMLNWVLPLARPFLNIWGLIAWAALILYSLYVFLPHLNEFLHDVHSVLNPNNWLWMGLIFVLVKSWHEFGHGVICKRFGGDVPDVGIMFLVLFPAPYVNATSSWNFPNKWNRILVSAAGMIFELMLAAIAAIIWVHSEPDSTLRQLSYNLVFLASVTTILFNGNPLLRFDGYYILSDLTEIANLYERSTRQIRATIQRYIYGMKNVTAVSTQFREQVWLVVYGIASQIYKVFIMFGIALFVAQAIPTLGILIAAWSIISWAVIPTGKFVHWLATSPALFRNRPRAVLTTVAAAAILFIAIGVIPADDHRRALGVVESEQRVDLAIQADGRIVKVFHNTGDRVKAGDVILQAENKELLARREENAADLKRIELLVNQAMTEKEPVKRQIQEYALNRARDQLAETDRQLAMLTVRSPQDGVLVAPQIMSLQGHHVKRGQVIGKIEDESKLRVTALVEQGNNSAVFLEGVSKIEMRLASGMDHAYPTQMQQPMQSGFIKLPHPALGASAGGAVATDPNDKDGLTALRQQFRFVLAMPRTSDAVDAKPLARPGERVYVRFTLAQRRPLLVQWVHRLRQIIRDRINVG